MNDVRYIDNPFFKIFNIINPDQTQLYSQLLKLLKDFFNNVKIPTLKAIASKPSETGNDTSVYVGSAGYLYMLIRAHRFFSNQSEGESEKFLSKSRVVGDAEANELTDPQFHLKWAIEQYRLLEHESLAHPSKGKTFSFFMSEVSVWLCGMHLGYLTQNHGLFRQNQARVISSFQQLKANIDKQYWQLLYGVPGFLYAILELQQYYDKVQELFQTRFAPIAVELTHMIIRKGLQNYEEQSKRKVDLRNPPEDFRLVYYFHKKEYLGGAHGLGGNLNIILTSMRLNDFGCRVKEWLPMLQGSVMFLLRHMINGNFTTSAGSQRIKLVHFCHGAPGIAPALARFADMFPEMGIQMGIKEVVETALNHIWKHGVLKKGFGLCHGISGNAYTFISPSVQILLEEKKEEYLKKARLMALLHEQEDVMKEIRTFNFKDRLVVGHSDEPYSLMVGVAGDICFTMDVLEGVGHFPGYDI